MKLLIIILLIIDVIIFLIMRRSKKNSLEEILKWMKDIVLFEVAIISLIMAVAVFDQFGMNKKLTEKRAELIIELITELKKQEGFGSNYYVNGEYVINPPFWFQKNMVEIYSQDSYVKDMLNTPILINSIDFDNRFKRIRKIINNPIMPESIVKKAEFLGLSGGTGNFKNSKLTYLYFTPEAKKELVNEKKGRWLRNRNNSCNLLEFIQKFDDLFKACEDWTNKHSNLNEPLNLKTI